MQALIIELYNDTHWRGAPDDDTLPPHPRKWHGLRRREPTAHPDT
jgi:hypothetical protein